MDKRQAEDILELNGRYTATDLRKAYIRALKEYHPDKHPIGSAEYDDATRLTQDVNVAKDLLQVFFDGGAQFLVSEPIEASNHGAAGYQSSRGSEFSQNAEARPTSHTGESTSWIDDNPDTYNFAQSYASVMSRMSGWE